MNPIIKVLINSIVSFMYMFFIAKLLGKKQISQLNFVDYVIGITIGSIAAEYATDDKNPWYYYIIGMSVFFLFDILVTLLSRKAQFLKKFLDGKPLVLITDGKIDYKQLKKSKIDVYDVLMMAREAGYFDLDDVAFGIFETNGSLSILPKGAERPTVAGDFKNISLEQSSLTNYIIVDGKIVKSTLQNMKLDKKTIISKLKKKKLEVKQIVLASYDAEEDTFEIHLK